MIANLFSCKILNFAKCGKDFFQNLFFRNYRTIEKQIKNIMKSNLEIVQTGYDSFLKGNIPVIF